MTPDSTPNTGSDAVSTPPPSRGRIRAEIVVVLALSLGASAVYSVVALIDRLTQETALADQTATINRPLDDRQYLDLTYQLLAILTDLAPVALVCFLLWSTRRPRLGRLGIQGSRWGRDSGWGAVLALGIGIPGLGIYLGGRAIGINVGVVASALDQYWWTVPVLVLAAVRSGIEEEVVMIGYLFARTGDLGWRWWQSLLLSATIRGTYHLYQGFGPFVANFAMGALFGWLYRRFGRLVPLIVAHSLIDIAVFVGYPYAVELFPALFGARD
jgi:membrane protease YdiL (CAAX protease family)